jgi:uncharacterized protein (DUF58 family)
MIVPSSRLLFWVAAVTLPAALLVAAVPAASPLAIVLAAAFGVAAAADAWAARNSLAGIGVELPTVARMSKDRENKLDVRIRNEAPRARPLRLALGWPNEVPPSPEELDIVLPAESGWSQLSWPCVPSRRGNYRIHSAYVEGRSPLGLWATRKAMPVQGEIRVYPNLMTERGQLASLFLNRGAFGVHTRRQVGRGRDFEKLREYTPGDGYDEIHWKATARRARPITKVFQIERTQEIYVVVDASRLSARRVGEGEKQTVMLERLVTAALVLGVAAEKQGDLFGLLSFTDKVESFVRAKNGKAHYGTCRDALYTLQPRSVTPDFDEVCSFIRLRLRRRALIIFLTSLDDPALAESFVRNVELIRRKHLVLVNMIRQPRTAPLFSHSGTAISKDASTDDLYLELGGHLRWHKLRQVEKTLRRLGIGFSQLENERLSAELVSQYLGVKQRQLL